MGHLCAQGGEALAVQVGAAAQARDTTAGSQDWWVSVQVSNMLPAGETRGVGGESVLSLSASTEVSAI